MGVGDGVLPALASLLPQLSLGLLDVAQNPVTDRGLAALGDVLFGMRGLRVLNLSRLPQVQPVVPGWSGGGVFPVLLFGKRY